MLSPFGWQSVFCELPDNVSRKMLGGQCPIPKRNGKKIKSDQGQRLGAMSNLDATCSAGNYVDLSKLDPHHTFSSSGVPLSTESRP